MIIKQLQVSLISFKRILDFLAGADHLEISGCYSVESEAYKEDHKWYNKGWAKGDHLNKNAEIFFIRDHELHEKYHNCNIGKRELREVICRLVYM